MYRLINRLEEATTYSVIFSQHSPCLKGTVNGLKLASLAACNQTCLSKNVERVTNH